MPVNGDMSESDTEEWLVVNAAQAANSEPSTSANDFPEDRASCAAAHGDANGDVARGDVDCLGALRVEMQPHFPAACASEPTTMMGMASLCVPASSAKATLARLDIVAVVDRSGSMSGRRIHLVKNAIDFMSRHLRATDKLALVSYSDTARVDFSLSPMDEEGQAMCRDTLDSMTASGQTNLGEGLLWGLGELACSDAPAAALLLFTDGLANRGMTSTEALMEAMQGPMSDMGRKSRAVFTLGFGDQHDAEMLFSIADAGTGCYSFINVPAAIGPCFADILGGMLSIAAQDVTLTLQASSGTTIGEVQADFAVEMSGDSTAASIRMRDLQGGTEKDVLFRLNLPSLPAPSLTWQGLECTVSYVDAATGLAKCRKSKLVVARPEDPILSERPHDVVESHRCRLVAAAAMEKAAHVAGGTCLKDAHAILSDAMKLLETSPALIAEGTRAAMRVRDLVADLRFCIESSKDAAICVKWCSSKAFAHKHQTSASAENSEYRNPLQVRLIEAAREEINQTLSAPSAALRGGRGKVVQSTKSVVSQSSATAGADTIIAGAMRVGMRILCRGQPGRLKDLMTSKTGKHGHAKVFFTVECDDGVIRQDIVPATQDVELAN